MIEGQFSNELITRPPSIADLRVGEKDLLGAEVTRIYARASQLYAIYEADGRIQIQFADDPAMAALQRTKLSVLIVTRARIENLVQGTVPRVAQRHQVRVAAALGMALADGVEQANTELSIIEAELSADLASRARYGQLLVGLLATFGVVAVGCALIIANAALSGNRYLIAAVTGAIGAFWSIALRQRKQPDLDRINFSDRSIAMLLAIFVGTATAIVVQLLFAGQIIAIKLAGLEFGPYSSPLLIVTVSLLAGFAERIMPDLLAQAKLVERSPGTGPPLALPSQTHLTDLISETVATSVTNVFAGTPLTNYNGYVEASLRWAPDEGRSGMASISLKFAVSEREGAMRLLVEGGMNALEANYVVECEPVGSPRDRLVQPIKVPTTGEYCAEDMLIHVPASVSAIWLQLFQSNRRLLVIELTVPPRPTADSD